MVFEQRLLPLSPLPVLPVQRQRGTLYNDERINSSGRHGILNICTTSNSTLMYMKQKLTETKRKIDDLTIFGDFNTYFQ